MNRLLVVASRILELQEGGKKQRDSETAAHEVLRSVQLIYEWC